MTIESLIPRRFLFRYSIPCLYRDPLWTDAGPDLGEEHVVPNFGALDDARTFAQLRLAWSEQGLAFSLHVDGKRQPPWCRDARPEESDGLRLWIDTRDTHNIHRATRFCHQFMFMPSGGGRRLDDAVADQLMINRAKDNAKPIRAGVLSARREKRVDGYLLEGLVPAGAMTGFDPAEHPRLGFTYAVVDRELGEQTLTCSAELPYREDPSLWATLELVRSTKAKGRKSRSS